MEENKKTSYKEAYPQNPTGVIKASLDRAHSPFKMLAHPDTIRKFAKGEKIHPIHIRFGLTNKCNLRCNFCNFHSSNESEFYNAFNYDEALETEDAIDVLKGFQSNGGKAVTFCGSGECTVHSGYKEICYSAYEYGLKIGLITNGAMFSNKELLECVANTHTWVRIGFNAGTAKTYSHITTAKESTFDNILAAVKYFRENAREADFKIGLNFVVTMDNYLEIVEAVRLAKEANAHYVRFEPEFYSALAHNTIYEKIDEILALFAEAKSMESENFEVSIPKLDRGPMDKTDKIEGDFKKCHYCNFVTAIGADGYIYPCPQIHLNEKYRMGSAVEDGGYDAWIKSGQKEAWEEENGDRTQNCKTCFYRPQNELLEWILAGKLDVEKVIKEYNKDNIDPLHKDFV